MHLNCYCCKTHPLKPTKLDYALPALRCEDCHGTYLDLLTYRTWLENNLANIEQEKRTQESTTGETVEIDALSNSESALICQRCSKFMLKYRINNEQANTINVCHTCDDVWLDQGEWELLKHLKIQDKLTQVMTEPWQKQLRNQEREQAFKVRYQQLLGDDFEQVEAFATWLYEHPKRSEIQHYLSAFKPID